MKQHGVRLDEIAREILVFFYCFFFNHLLFYLPPSASLRFACLFQSMDTRIRYGTIGPHLHYVYWACLVSKCALTKIPP